MSNQLLLSLCIPTNGVVEWVFPVLESIYAQNIDENLFEVIVSDNGNNLEFEHKMTEYAKEHSNIVYKKTNAYEFLSEPEAYKLASGKLIKFINHRTKLLPNTLSYLINFVKDNENKEQKPIIYFSNGVLNNKEVRTYCTFSDFVSALGIYSSWSTGMTIWKEHFDKLSKSTKYNVLFPHTTILFNERQQNQYIVDDTILLDEMPQGKKPKGSYDLFYAFAVEYPSILLDLVKDKDLTVDAFLKIKKDILTFCSSLAVNYFIFRMYCSYDLNSFNKSMRVFFCKNDIIFMMFKIFVQKITKFILKSLTKK